MINEAKAFAQRLGVEYHDEMLPYYGQALKLDGEVTSRMFDRERIRALNKKYNFLRYVEEELLAAMEEIERDHDLVLLNGILYLIIKDGKRTGGIMPVPKGGSRKLDFGPAPSVLYFVESGAALLEERGLPWEIISDSLWGLESEMLAYRDMHGRYGCRDYFDWYLYFVRGEIIRIGRLQYQFVKFTSPVRVFRREGRVTVMMDNVDMHRGGMMHGALGHTDEEGKYFADVREDDNRVTGYVADRYGEVSPEPVTLEGFDEPLKRGDNVISIHITNGEPFTFELVEESFRRAGEVWKKYYADMDIKGYYGYSWVFNKHLRDILGRDTNITRLADLFDIFPTRGGHHGIFEYVFSVPGDTPIEELPERTSMQRGIKKYLQGGNLFLEMAGVMLL